MATQDPDPKTVLGTTNFLRPTTTRVFVRFGGFELEQLDPGSQGLKPEGSDLGFKRCLHSPFTPSANAGELFV